MWLLSLRNPARLLKVLLCPLRADRIIAVRNARAEKLQQRCAPLIDAQTYALSLQDVTNIYAILKPSFSAVHDPEARARAAKSRLVSVQAPLRAAQTELLAAREAESIAHRDAAGLLAVVATSRDEFFLDNNFIKNMIRAAHATGTQDVHPAPRIIYPRPVVPTPAADARGSDAARDPEAL